MSLTPAGWHARFQEQARWTAELRRYLYARCPMARAKWILEVGCGTGALLGELSAAAPQARVCGVDLLTDRLKLVRGAAPCAGSALRLPFPSASMDITLCHFLLLWLDDPAAALKEMGRVTRPGGVVMALAEPDYGGRIDYPESLVKLGRLQADSLRAQGANPLMGRMLAASFARAGFQKVETGLLGGQWSGPPSVESWQSEWTVLAEDLGGQVPAAELDELCAMDRAAWQHGERILFIPTFYAFAVVDDDHNGGML
ncbi:MAG TPA: class I SAM-dependent methyltransferase [Anaerolineaceae bacterium]|nr:class I SAM-dependent methyltransferase [Anaerolineaceae bacterium]HPN53376.1 class I SAM-dependent methyltransferase [Anaerolineaceae bacterium]